MVVCTLNPNFENMSSNGDPQPVLFEVNNTEFEKNRNF